MFITGPGKNNTRMQQQQGAFIYDNVFWEGTQYKSFEDYLSKMQDEYEPTLEKILISDDCVSDAFETLDHIGITGSSLFLDYSGAAMDAKNSFFYDPYTASYER